MDVMEYILIMSKTLKLKKINVQKVEPISFNNGKNLENNVGKKTKKCELEVPMVGNHGDLVVSSSQQEGVQKKK